MLNDFLMQRRAGIEKSFTFSLVPNKLRHTDEAKYSVSINLTDSYPTAIFFYTQGHWLPDTSIRGRQIFTLVLDKKKPPHNLSHIKKTKQTSSFPNACVGNPVTLEWTNANNLPAPSSTLKTPPRRRASASIFSTRMHSILIASGTQDAI